jgi:tungstate transport system substrate-binding protein
LVRRSLPTITLAAALLMGCASEVPSVLRLATTTSVQDSGLLGYLLPVFGQQTGVEVDVVAVGTGQALALGESGDADLLLVHDPEGEQAFVEAGFGTERIPLMRNDFVLVGTPSDPAGIRGLPAATALRAIYASGAAFASRGDESGTHAKELQLWAAAGEDPTEEDWYLSLGQGMGETLITANELGAYTLTDRATFLALAAELPRLVVLVGGDAPGPDSDPDLANPYSLIPINPEVHPQAQADEARWLVDWLLSAQAQARIAAFGVAEFGQPLFYPASAP